MTNLRSGARLVASVALLAMALAGCDGLRAVFPSSHHDTVAPDVPTPERRPAVLLFSKTNGFRHTEAIDAGVPAFLEMARTRGWDVFATENGAVHTPEHLARFDVIVWFNVSGDVLSEDQRAALLARLEAGAGFFGIHGTGGDPGYEWAAHPDRLVRARFTRHVMGPQFQEGTIRVESTEHPVMRGIDAAWTRVEEWYSFEKSPRGPEVEVLATLDESTYSPRFKMLWMDDDISMGDHPIIWSHCVGRGRAIFSALGHQAAAYAEPTHLRFLGQAIDWLAETPAAGCAVPTR